MSWRDWYVSAPNPDAGFVETAAFNIWASRTSRIETLIEVLAASVDPNDEAIQEIAFTKAGFTGTSDLTSSEIEYVQDEVAKRWVG